VPGCSRHLPCVPRDCIEDEEENGDPEREQDPAVRIKPGRLAAALGPLLDRLCVSQQHVLEVAHAGADAAGEVAAPKRRQDRVLDDELAQEVGDDGLQPAPDLDANAALVGRDDEQHAVVAAGLADAPSAAELVAEVLDLVALQRWQRDDDELVARLLLERGELRLDRGPVLGLQQTRVVDDAAGELGKIRLGARGC
jgi:hypothetical protein